MTEQANEFSPDGRVRQRDSLLTKIRQAEHILDVVETYDLQELDCEPREGNTWAEILRLVTLAHSNLTAARDRAGALLVAAKNMAETVEYEQAMDPRA